MTRRNRRSRTPPLRDAGADCVKFEGAQPDVVAALTAEGFDVCGHLGLESQHQDVKRRQGKTAEAAAKLYADALAADAAGQKFLVLELVPEELAARITARRQRRDDRHRRRPRAPTARCWSSTTSPA